MTATILPSSTSAKLLSCPSDMPRVFISTRESYQK